MNPAAARVVLMLRMRTRADWGCSQVASCTHAEHEDYSGRGTALTPTERNGQALSHLGVIVFSFPAWITIRSVSLFGGSSPRNAAVLSLFCTAGVFATEVCMGRGTA